MEDDPEDLKIHSSSNNASPSSTPPLPDDSWSDGATSVLIDAWGKRFLERERQPFTFDDWKSVSYIVSNRQLHTGALEKPPVQCYDRMALLEMRYREEKKKTGEPSNWMFFDRMDRLIGSRGKKRMRIDRERNLNRNSEAKAGGSSEGRVRNSGDLVSELTRAVGQFVKEIEKQGMEFEKQRMQLLKDTQLEIVKMNKKLKAKFSERGQGRRRDYEDSSVSELTRAVAGLVEVYERVEKSKLEQMVEMEKGRIEFEKGLELQRIQFLRDAGLEVAQMMRSDRKIKPSDQEQQKQGEAEDGAEQELQQEKEK